MPAAGEKILRSHPSRMRFLECFQRISKGFRSFLEAKIPINSACGGPQKSTFKNPPLFQIGDKQGGVSYKGGGS